jgi:hypothetical protein
MGKECLYVDISCHSIDDMGTDAGCLGWSWAER